MTTATTQERDSAGHFKKRTAATASPKASPAPKAQTPAAAPKQRALEAERVKLKALEGELGELPTRLAKAVDAQDWSASHALRLAESELKIQIVEQRARVANAEYFATAERSEQAKRESDDLARVTLPSIEERLARAGDVASDAFAQFEKIEAELASARAKIQDTFRLENWQAEMRQADALRLRASEEARLARQQAGR